MLSIFPHVELKLFRMKSDIIRRFFSQQIFIPSYFHSNAVEKDAVERNNWRKGVHRKLHWTRGDTTVGGSYVGRPRVILSLLPEAPARL